MKKQCTSILNSLFVIGIILMWILPKVSASPDPFPVNETIFELVEQVNPDFMEENAQHLLNFHTRHTYSDTLSDTLGIGAARRWMIGEHEDNDVGAQLYHWNGFRHNDNYPCYNVHATIPGERENEGIIILGAHLDSRGVDRNDVEGFAPGIDDDGSGCLALMEIGRILSGQAIERTIVLSAFTGEEQGLLGARAFAGELADNNDPVYAMLNMDMIGHIVFPDGEVDSSTMRLYSGGPSGSPSRQLARYIKWVGEEYSDGLVVNIIPQQDRGGRSGDHIPFYENGFPAARLIETAEDVDFQHGPNDIPDGMSFTYAARVTRLALGVTALLAMAPDIPPTPEVINSGDGQSLIVSWPDSLNRNEVDLVRIAFRSSDSLYWENIVESNGDSPFLLSGLTAETEYFVSISISGENGMPSRFSSENTATPDSIPSAPLNFETTSTSTGVDLIWTPGIEVNTDAYLIERRIAGREFEHIMSIDHPSAEWTDSNVDLGEMYYYRIRIQNSLDLLSEYSNVQEGRMASHHLGVLIIDNTPDGSSVDRPDDNEVDTFYLEVLRPYNVSAIWDRSDSLRFESTLSDADLSPYELVLIHSDGVNASFSENISTIEKYHSNGGKVIFTGLRLSSVFGGKREYSNNFLQGEFMKDFFGIDSINVSFPGRNWFIGATGLAGFPTIEYDFERIPDREGQIFMDAIISEEPIPGSEIIATYVAGDGDESDFHGRAVAMRDDSDTPSWIMVDLPGYNMRQETMVPFLRMALENLNAPLSIIKESEIKQLDKFELFPAFPNPFNSRVRLEYEIPENKSTVLQIFDTSGRSILSRNIRAFGKRNRSFVWDADLQPSGVYLCRIDSGSDSRTVKFVLMR